MLLTLFLLAAVAFPAAADIETAVEITTLSFLTRNATGEAMVYLLGKGNLSFSAIGNDNVRAVAELAGIWAGNLAMSPEDILKRLFVKINFGGFYLTAGKTRVSFGEGFVFNAGDVIFGSLEPPGDLSESVLRDETDWLIDGMLPLGLFSYIEGILLPFSPLDTDPLSDASVYKLRGGGRVVTKLAGIKLEGGYLFKADEAVHHPYVSLQGNLFFDAQLSASWKIPADGAAEEQLRQGLAVTGGLFRIFQFDDGSALTVRLEAVWRPFGLWRETQAPLPEGHHYALLLYPEIEYSPFDVLSLQLRSLISPVDASGLVSFGVTFGIYQGLDLLGYVWTMWGEADDEYFGWGREGDIGVSLGLQFIY
ncbi:MAG TPA: hypothetical protein ENN69_05720 [Spirochaetia bacterium]|nr:hypothetical protein [Spirochaetia bacterium]